MRLPTVTTPRFTLAKRLGLEAHEYISQRTPAGADATYIRGEQNCGPTCLAMIGREIGFRPELNDAELISFLGTIGKTTKKGTDLENFGAMASAMGLRSEVRKGADVSWLRQQLNQGRRVIANGNPMAWQKSDARQYGHYIVVRKPKGSNFEVADPYFPDRKTATPEMMERYLKQHHEGGNLISIW